MRDLVEKFLKDVGIDTDVDRDTYRGTLKEMLINDLNEVTLATTIIIKNEVLGSSLFGNYDKALEIAKDFVASPYNDQDWDEVDFEEEVVKFAVSVCGNS